MRMMLMTVVMQTTVMMMLTVVRLITMVIPKVPPTFPQCPHPPRFLHGFPKVSSRFPHGFANVSRTWSRIYLSFAVAAFAFACHAFRLQDSVVVREQSMQHVRN